MDYAVVSRFTARRYASVVYAFVMCLSLRSSVRPSVSLSVRHRPALCQNG